MSLHLLPPQPTPFIGRESELSDIARMLADPACRLLTLVGPGGIGKTRLAIEAARQTILPDGSHFVPLQPLTSPDFMVPAIAVALDFQFYQVDDPKQQLLNSLQNKSMLLLLDNFEHLLDGVSLLSEILAAAPDIKLLITSRERLNLQEEWVLDIYGLDYPQDDIISMVEQYSAIHFFLKCACRVKADFQITETNQANINHICRLVEGVPLGIELAASWVRVLSCQAIGAAIEHNLDFLTSSVRNIPEKHASMRAVFGQSYNLLMAEQQQVFKKLSVFRGGFRPEAAQAVANASLMTLAAMVDKSLLRVSADGRYDMHELLRQYGDDQLSATDTGESVHDAHNCYFADFVHQRVDDLKGHRQLEAIAEINADFENVRIAWNWASDHHNEDRIDKMLDGLALFCDLHNRSQEGWALMRYAKTQFAADRHFERVWGRLASHVSDETDDLQDELQTALQIAQRYHDLTEVAFCLWRLGAAAHNKRKFAAAKQLFEQSLLHYRQLGDRYSVAGVLFELMTLSYQENWRNFKGFGEESLRLRHEIGDRIGAAWSIAPVAVGEGRVGHFAEAEHLWHERIALGQEAGAPQLTAMGYAHLSYQVYFIQGDFDKTRAAAEEALKVASGLYRSNATACALITLGLLASMEERYEEGQILCQKGASARGLAYVDGLAAWGLSIAACGLGDYAAAGECLSAALNYLFNLRGLTGIIASLPIAAILLVQRGDRVRALELLALAFTHPVRAAGWMEKCPLLGRLRSTLEQALGYEAYAAAWERGTRLDVDAVAAEVQQQFQGKPGFSKGKEAQSPTTTLSERELEVLRLVAEGCSNQDIANRLYIGVSTVKKHINHIYDKLDVKNRTQAVAVARQRQILT